MKIPVNLTAMKPQAVHLLGRMLTPSGPEVLGPRLGSWLRDIWGQLDAVVAAGGEGAVEVQLAMLSDADLRRLALRLRCVQDALLDTRPGKDLAFLQLLAGLRVAASNEMMLREIAAGHLHLVNGNVQPDEDEDVVL